MGEVGPEEPAMRGTIGGPGGLVKAGGAIVGSISSYP